MTFQDFIQRNDSHKVVLLELDQAVPLISNFDDWVKYSPEIWMIQYSWDANQTFAPDLYGWGNQMWGDSEFGKGSEPYNREPDRERPFRLASVQINGQIASEAPNTVELKQIPNGWYWDQELLRLYINTGSDIHPLVAYESIEVGITKGYANVAGHYGALYYDGRLLSVPNIDLKKDPLFFGRLSFEGGSASLINTDGYFNSFGSSNYYGSELRIYFGSPDIPFEEFQIQYTGYIEEYSLNNNQITIKFKDNRELLSEPIPPTPFTLAEFPLLDSANDNQPQPVIYGSVRRIPVVCINQSAGAGPYTFKVADTTQNSIQAIDNVYVNGVKVTHTLTDLDEGTFQLSSGYTPGQEVTADVKGYVVDTVYLTNPIEILIDIITRYTPAVYNNSFFDVATFEAFKTQITSPIGVYVGQATQVIDVIEQITTSIFSYLIINGDGKYTLSKSDSSKEPVATIYIADIISPPSVRLPSKEYLNSVTINYDRAWNVNKGILIQDNSRKQELFRQFKKNVNHPFDTLLTNKTDAEALATEIINYYGGIFPIYTVSTKTQHIPLQIGDNIFLEVGKWTNSDNSSKLLKCEVIGKSLNLSNYSITFELRFIEASAEGIDLFELTEWSSARTYTRGANVTSNGQVWRAIDVSTGVLPQPDSNFWQSFGKLYWFDNIDYVIGDKVIHNNKMWHCIADNSDSEPGVGSDWQVLGNVFVSETEPVAEEGDIWVKGSTYTLKIRGESDWFYPELPSNVALRDTNNTFTATNTFSHATISGAQALAEWRVRNIYVGTVDPVALDGNDGDVWIVAT